MSLAVVGCYLLGSVPFGLLVSRGMGIDIREHGSRNIGATNVGRVLGFKWGAVVLGLDLAKGLLPTAAVGAWVTRSSAVLGAAEYGWWLLAATACILGHIYPVYLGFRGGKGVATTLGASLAVYPDLTLAMAVCLAIGLAVTAISRYVSLGSLSAAVAIPLTVWFFFRPLDLQQHWPVLLYSIALPAVVMYRHRDNIRRLWHGTERRIGQS